MSNSKLSNYLFVAPLLLIISCKTIKPPVLESISQIKLVTMDKTSTTLSLRLLLNNPNKTRLRLKNANGSIWLERRLLGQFYVDTMIRVSSMAEFEIPVNVEIRKKDILPNAISLLLKSELLFKVDGTATIGKSGFFIKYPFKYEGIQHLSSFKK